MTRPLNGPGDEVWKQADEERVVHQRIGRLQLSVIYVDDVGHFLECVKGDPGRKENAQSGDGNVMKAERFERGRERIDKEVEVLEDGQKSQVDDERQGQQRSPPARPVGPCDSARAVEIDNCR